MSGTRPITAARLARLRSSAQLLHRPAPRADPVEVVRSAAAIQAQDWPAARLGVRARGRRLSADEVDAACFEQCSLVRTWLMRQTIHLIAADDLPWMHALLAPRVGAWVERRLGHLGVAARAQERASGLLADELASAGRLTRERMTKLLAPLRLDLADNRISGHLARLVAVQGHATLGPAGHRGRPTLIAQPALRAKAAAVDRGSALAELARRYLRAYGPAGDADLARWSGLPLRDARAAIGAIAPELEQMGTVAGACWAVRSRRRAEPRQVVRLGPAFDGYLLGYEAREFALDPDLTDAVNRGGGIIRPVVLVGGRVQGTWRLERERRRLTVAVTPFRPLAEWMAQAIGSDARDVGRFEGLPATLRLEPSLTR